MSSGSGDHPRSRGVYPTSITLLGLARGSSPLARGLPRDTARAALERRIIPARAGFTRFLGVPAIVFPDHPRSRGVYPIFLRPRIWSLGSSPLARGLPMPGVTHNGEIRIIPARAGFTLMTCLARLSPEDHPRSRGVYFPAPLAPGLTSGSSPLARGLRGVELQSDGRVGIIPARAGFTRTSI